MMTKKKGYKITFLILLLHLFSTTIKAQTSFFHKIELGYLKNQFTMVQYDVDSGWLGYKLPDNVNGANLNWEFGYQIKDWALVGLNAGYLQFGSTQGYLVNLDAMAFYLEKPWRLHNNLRIGASHIFNQYEGGTITPYFELAAGLSYTNKKNTIIYGQVGFSITQEVLFLPIRVGVKL